MPARTPTPPLSIAPMMERTDRHFRMMMRFITRRTLLYTEMVVTGAVLRGDRDRQLGFDPLEHPVALQLGGDDPQALAECARMAEDRGYDEVNINVGCPSSRVQKGCFGVSLMARPERVAACVAAMRAAVAIPVTVKHRIGFDEVDRYDDMARFVRVVSEAGADRFTVHARKAWLQGLSPKQNRNVPPLRYEEVFRLKDEHPHLEVELNGGVRTLDAVTSHLERVDGVMIGRGAWDAPMTFADADSRVFGVPDPGVDAVGVADAMIAYAERWLSGGRDRRLGPVARPMLNLMHGRRGARGWRRRLSEGAFRTGAGPEVIADALAPLREPAPASAGGASPSDQRPRDAV